MKFLARSDVLINDPKRTSWNSETSRPKIFSWVSFNSLKFLSHISYWDCGNVLWKYIHMYVWLCGVMKNEASFLQLSKYTVHWDQNWPTGHILSHSSNDSCVYSSGWSLSACPHHLNNLISGGGEAEGSAKSDMNLSRVCTLPDANAVWFQIRIPFCGWSFTLIKITHHHPGS